MQARGITEKAYVERCTAGGTLPPSTAAEPRTRPVATPSKLLRQCRPRNRVPHRRGLLQTTTTPSPFWRSTSASTPQSLEFLVSGSRRTPRRPALSGNASPPARRRKSRTGPGAAHRRGKSGGAQSHRHSITSIASWPRISAKAKWIAPKPATVIRRGPAFRKRGEERCSASRGNVRQRGCR
jgi:hypothetical protein